MEVFWIYPWLVWFREMPSFHWERTSLTLLSLIFLVGVPFFINRYIPGHRKSLQILKLIMVLVTILVVLRVEYGAGIGLFSGQWFVHIGKLIVERGEERGIFV